MEKEYFRESCNLALILSPARSSSSSPPISLSMSMAKEISKDLVEGTAGGWRSSQSEPRAPDRRRLCRRPAEVSQQRNYQFSMIAIHLLTFPLAITISFFISLCMSFWYIHDFISFRKRIFPGKIEEHD